MPRDGIPTGEKTNNRRQFLQALGATGALGLAGCVGDDPEEDPDPADDGDDTDAGDDDDQEDDIDYPEQDIRMIIPFSPGGGYDFYARLLAKHLPEHLPNDVNVQPQNVEGAEGRIALNELNDADPDGHTIGIMHVQRFTQQFHLYDTDYDIREFTWFPTITEEYDAIAIADHLVDELDSWDDFVQGVQDGDFTEASTGPTSGGTVSMITLGQVAGLWDADDILDNHVVTDGTGDSIQLLLGQEADYINGSVSSVVPFMEAGDLHGLMYYTIDDEIPYPDFSPEYAETLSTADIPDAQAVRDVTMTVRAFAGPPDMPDEITEILRQAISDAIQSDALQAEAEEEERPIVYRDGESTEELVLGAIDAWGEQEELLEALD